MYPLHSLLLLSLVLLTSCAQDIGPLSVEAKPHSARTVATAVLTPHAISETVEAVGTVKSAHPTVLAAKTMSSVVAVHVKAGDQVRTGQVLVTLDDRELQAQLQKAQAGHQHGTQALVEIEHAIRAAHNALDAATAQHALAKATAARYATLFARGSLAPQEYDTIVAQQTTAMANMEQAAANHTALQAKRQQVRATITQNRAELTQAKVTLSYATITAPRDGYITAKAADVGMVTTPGTPLLTFESADYVLEATLREADLNKVQVGHEGTVAIGALEKELVGRIGEILPMNSPLSRSFIVKVPLVAQPGLRSGLYGTARFTVGQRSGIVVPLTALVERGQLQSVFVVDQRNIASMRLVTTGKTTPQGIELLTGVAVGERLVLHGVDTLTDGTSVTEGTVP